MEMTTLIIVGVIVLIAIITIIGILSRYRKCKSDELLVVYGKTGSHKEKVNELDAKGNQVSREVEIKTARVYHGGAAFVWPIIQGYEVMSMRPIQLNLTLKDALSAQNIRVTVPTTVTVAISQDPLIMQNAANRLLGVDDTDKESLIVEMAPAKAVEKMIECGMTPQMIVQYKTVDQLKGIAEASAEMYEHIHLGQVTVYGNENTAGSFMAKTAENLNPAFELLKSIPFKKTFKEMFVEDKKDNPTEDNFEAVK